MRKQNKINKKENLHDGHRQRLRERLVSENIDNFEPHEVLQYLLFHVIPRKDTNEIGHKLINRFGSLSGVLEAHPKELQKVDGVTEVASIFLSSIPQVSRYYFSDKWKPKTVINNTAKAAEIMIDYLAGYTNEVFCVIFLDNQSRLIHKEIVYEGTINEAPVYPRIIVEATLRHKANFVILGHNHPGGSTRISKSDVEATRVIKSALNPIGVKILDHIVVAGSLYSSFVENHYL